jgi:hypothetical protein
MAQNFGDGPSNSIALLGRCSVDTGNAAHNGLNLCNGFPAQMIARMF